VPKTPVTRTVTFVPPTIWNALAWKASDWKAVVT
jgi:hypothetical protein